MNGIIHRTIYFLVFTLVVNAVGWTFNKEAVADVWFDQHCEAVGDNYSSAEPKDHKTFSPKSQCNHWCYNIGNFIGPLTQWVHVLPEFANEYFPTQSFVVKLTFPDGHFRPPRPF